MNNCYYNEIVTEVRKTNNYDMFKTMMGNREIKSTNYKKLIKSMGEKQLVMPICCNEKLEIIDGQHRFMASQQLKLPVYYYIVPGYEIEDVKRANLVSCNWGLNDYLNLHCKLNKKSYIIFKGLVDKYYLKVPQLIEIISTLEGKDYGRIKLLFEDGSFEIQNSLLQIETFLQCLLDFKHLKSYNSPKFTKAFLKLYIYDKYDHKIMQRKLKSLSCQLEKKQTYADYLSLLVNDIYTYGSAYANFKYDSRNNRFYDI